MKKLLTILGIIFLGLIIAGVIGILAVSHVGAKLDRQSQSYVDRVVPAIVSSWDAGALIGNASPELLEAASRQQLKEMIDIFSRELGPLREYQGSKGEASINVSPAGKFVTAEYQVQAAFEKAGAGIVIGLIQRDGGWQILEFRVHSKALGHLGNKYIGR